MRLPVVAASGLLAVSIWDAAPPAIAAPVPTNSPKPQDWVVPTTSVTAVPANQSIAQPEAMATREVARSGSSPMPPMAATVAVPMAAPTVAKPVAAPLAKTLALAPRADVFVPVEAPEATVASSAAPIGSKPTAIAAAPVAQLPVKPPVKPVAPAVSKPAVKPAAQPVVKAPAPDVAVTLTDVTIVGAGTELQDIARRQITTTPGSSITNAVLSSQLQTDVAKLLETGLFTTATATRQTNRDGVSVSFQVDPVIFKGVQLVNAQGLTPAVAAEIFKAQIGQPIAPSALNQGVRQVNQWYAQNGYSVARAIGLTPNRSGIMTLTVAEGPIGAVRIQFTDEFGRTVDDKGNAIKGRTQESWIRKQIKVTPGQAYKEADAQADLQRIFQTGLFRGGTVSLEGDARSTTVVYQLAEAPSRQINGGVGFSTDAGLYGNGLYRDNNVGGTGKQIGGNVLVGTRDLQFSAQAGNPYRPSDPNSWGYTASAFRQRGLSQVFDNNITLSNGNQVREGKFGGGLTFDKALGNGWTTAIGANYARTSLRDQNGKLVKTDDQGNQLSFSKTGLDDLYTVGIAAVRDMRDNPADPKSGSLIKLSTTQSVPIGVGSLLSNRLQADYSQYVPIGLFNRHPATSDQQEVLAFNLQGGTVMGDLPPYSAYTLGGVNSVRGYGQGSIGTGRSYAQATAEYRFPIFSIVGGTLFADYATTFGSSQAVPGQPADARGLPGSGFGIGGGVRVKSPLGLLRADLGFTDRGTSRLQFSVGEKF
jgi:outer membrane protein insertion porin family